MHEMKPLLFFIAYSVLITTGVAKFKISDVNIEVFQPKGLRISYQDEPGLELFAFHGQVNSQLDENEHGEISGEVTKPESNYWVIYKPDIELKIGDEVNYWIYVQHNRLGYRKDGVKFKVKEFKDFTTLKCVNSQTTVNGVASYCIGSLIFEENFDSFNESAWIKEQYIPTKGPNYEFNSYQSKFPSTYNGVLILQPSSKTTDAELRGTLDLSNGCTSTDPQECTYTHQRAFLLPPVDSAKVRTRFSFKYGKVEIRAKLPTGDWIVPEISLIPTAREEERKGTKIVIAYSRGNNNLESLVGLDIGGKLLFAGPTITPTEPSRSSKWVSVRQTEPFSAEFHTYSLTWKPGQIQASVDGNLIGTVEVHEHEFSSREFQLTLGVSVGGINDFPNGYVSSSTQKPWINKDPKQVKNFFEARNVWLPTWKSAEHSLNVDSMRIFAV